VLLIVLETTQASIQKIEFTLQRPWRFIWFGCADHILPEVSILCYNVNYSPAKKNRTGNLDMHRLQQLERLPTTKRKRTWTEDDFAVLTSKQVVWKNFGNFQHSALPTAAFQMMMSAKWIMKFVQGVKESRRAWMDLLMSAGTTLWITWWLAGSKASVTDPGITELGNVFACLLGNGYHQVKSCLWDNGLRIRS